MILEKQHSRLYEKESHDQSSSSSFIKMNTNKIVRHNNNNNSIICTNDENVFIYGSIKSKRTWRRLQTIIVSIVFSLCITTVNALSVRHIHGTQGIHGTGNYNHIKLNTCRNISNSYTYTSRHKYTASSIHTLLFATSENNANNNNNNNKYNNNRSKSDTSYTSSRFSSRQQKQSVAAPQINTTTATKKKKKQTQLPSMPHHARQLLQSLQNQRNEIQNLMTIVPSTSLNPNPDWDYVSSVVYDMIHSIRIHRHMWVESQSKQQLKQQLLLHTYQQASQIVNDAIQSITQRAFSSTKSSSYSNNRNYNNSHNYTHGVLVALQVMNWQCNSSKYSYYNSNYVLVEPYNTIPRNVWLNALRALNSLMVHTSNDHTNIHTNINSNNNTLMSSTVNTDKNLDPTSFTASNGVDTTFIHHHGTLVFHHSNYAKLAFRILQRLCTGKGIRYSTTTPSAITSTSTTTTRMNNKNYTKSNTKQTILPSLDERDFAMVLNGFVNQQQMNMAHQVVALQERIPHAPPLSPVTYSILIKGYGRLRDLVNVNHVLYHATVNHVQPDIVMLNSLIDAFINCNEFDAAWDIFLSMANGSQSATSTINERNEISVTSDKEEEENFGEESWKYLTNKSLWKNLPQPNLRTHNIILKGFVKNQNIHQAINLSNQMKEKRMWDAVTTNTLVSAALAVNDFDLAESLLANHTVVSSKEFKLNNKSKSNYRRQHPNVEAYTELIDKYAKSSKLKKALSTLQLMRNRGVQPNEYSYTSIISALTKAHKISQAKQMLEFMENVDLIRPTVITYNSFLSGMLGMSPILNDDNINNNSVHNSYGQIHNSSNSTSQYNNNISISSFHHRVDLALQLLDTMKQKGSYPNAVTIGTIVDAFGKCSPPRTKQAHFLIDSMNEFYNNNNNNNKRSKDNMMNDYQSQNVIISTKDVRIATPLIRAYANEMDLEGVSNTYDNVIKPDVICFNTYLDACCRCGKVTKAIQIMMENTEVSKLRSKYRSNNVGSDNNQKNQFMKMDDEKKTCITPDVISYSILISTLLKIGNSSASSQARLLYKDMKQYWGIMPDTGLVDIILTSLIANERLYRLDDKDIRFIYAVLRDAKKLEWTSPQHLERRERVVNALFLNRMNQLWKEDGFTRDMDPVEDPLFQKKKWNRIESGFRLWGSTTTTTSNTGSNRSSYVGTETLTSNRNEKSKIRKKDEVDKFLESKKWNDIDSSFRII